MGDTDRYPNYFSGSLALSSGNTFTTTTIRLPINRLGRVSGTRAVVLEFLWAVFETRGHDYAADGDSQQWSMQVGSTPVAVSSYNDPDLVCKIRDEVHMPTAVGHIKIDNIKTVNLTSSDGFGVLVASENLHISGVSTGHAAAITLTWRLYYRFVSVPALEMMGILQSQTT